MKAISGLLILALVYFVLLPIIGVLVYGFFDTQKSLTVKDVLKVLEMLLNSMIISIPATVCSVIFGVALALTAYRLDTPLGPLFRLIGFIPLIDPPFVGSIAFIMLFGRNGLITHRLLNLTVSPYGWHGIILLQVLSFSAIAYLMISSAVKNVDLSLEDVARTLGEEEAGIFFRVTLPMMMPEIANTALLIFLMSLADFTTPLIIGGSFQTLASSIYIQITGVFNMRIAALTGAVLLVPCILAFVVHRYRVRGAGYVGDAGSSRDVRFRAVHPGVRIGLVALSSLVAALIVVKNLFIITGALVNRWGYDYTPTISHFQRVLGKDFTPFLNTIQLAVVVAFVASLLGVSIAYLVRYKKISGPNLVEFLAMFPAAIPGILFGIGYLVIFRYPLFGVGRFVLSEWPSVILLGTKMIIYLICIARFLNVGVRTGYATLEHIDPDIESAALTLGATQWFAFTRVMMPILGDAFFSAFFKNLSTTMTTLGAIILLILPSNKVAIQMLFQILASSTIGDGAAMAILISVINILMLLMFHLIFYFKRYKQSWRRWRDARED